MLKTFPLFYYFISFDLFFHLTYHLIPFIYCLSFFSTNLNINNKNKKCIIHSPAIFKSQLCLVKISPSSSLLSKNVVCFCSQFPKNKSLFKKVTFEEIEPKKKTRKWRQFFENKLRWPLVSAFFRKYRNVSWAAACLPFAVPQNKRTRRMLNCYLLAFPFRPRSSEKPKAAEMLGQSRPYTQEK